MNNVFFGRLWRFKNAGRMAKNFNLESKTSRVAASMVLMVAGTAIYSRNYLTFSDAQSFGLSSDQQNELRSLVQRHQIDFDKDECTQRGKPWNSYHSIVGFPDAIVYPETTEDVSKILKFCSKYEIPVVAFGGGTSLEGHTLAPKGGISLDFQNMDKIIKVNDEDLDVVVQAGVGYVDLNEFLKDKGLWFPLDPGPGAKVGGMCACRCSGSTAVRYGSMRDNVLNLTAVLPDGTIVKTASRARKSSAGYDLTRLLIGSEGTLAVVTEATLKIHNIPKVSYAVRVAFPSGVRAAATTAKEVMSSGVTVGRCELLDDVMVQLINRTNPEQTPWLEHTTLMFEVTGISESAAREQRDVVVKLAERNGGRDIYTATEAEETKRFWNVRKQCLWLAMSQYPDREPMITDVCVPLSELPSLIEASKRRIQASSLPCPIIAHAGDGNFHVLIFFKTSDAKEVKEAKELSNWMAKQAIAMGGTCTGEHGIGVGKKDLLRLEMGDNTMKFMSLIKTTIDPLNIMNPGKVLDVDIGSEKKK